MPAIRQPGRISENTTLSDIGMYGVAVAAAVYLNRRRQEVSIDGGKRIHPTTAWKGETCYGLLSMSGD